jgi:hypothetical protein
MSQVFPLLGFRLVRLEVATQSAPEGPELQWIVWATDDDDPFTLVLGYLACRAPKGYGQARVAATIHDRTFANEERPGDLELWIREHVLETLYDTGRRAINAQAAAMDVTLEMPTKAPEVVIARIPSAESTS